MAKKKAVRPGLVLADIPERQRLRDLQRELAELRDAIATADLDIEIVREQLSVFEAYYHQRLRGHHDLLQRVQNLVSHIERWIHLLEEAPQGPWQAKATRVDARREQELQQVRAAQAAEAVADDAQVHDNGTESAADDADTWQPEVVPEDRGERLKKAYRDLARRFHPDLARTEEERLKNSEIMARINVLYRDGDLDRLVALREQAQGGDIDDPDMDVADQVNLLSERLAWFTLVLKNLGEERQALEASSTCALWRNAEQAKERGEDIFAALEEGLQERIAHAYADIDVAVRSLEDAVSRYNRHAAAEPTGNTPGLVKSSRRSDAMQTFFDPYADKELVRLGLEQLDLTQVSHAARKHAAWLETLAVDNAALLRLILFTHVTELSPFPLTGMEKYDDLKLRFDTLNGGADAQPGLKETWVQADTLVEYGVRRATAKVAHVGLRFRDKDLRDAVPLALQAFAVRREFRRVLGVLGEHCKCPACQRQIFAIPLYRTRGLDDMRASMCPQCGETLRSYWMPRGKDVQAVLNTAFVDFEIVSEWSFSLARATIAMQLVPFHLETLTLGHLKTRLVDDVFNRYALEIEREHVELVQNKQPVDDATLLATLPNRRFQVRLVGESKLTEGEALEIVRHRIRNKFSDK